MTRYRFQANVTLYENHIDIVDSVGAKNRSEGVREIIEQFDDVQAALRGCIKSVPRWVYVDEGDKGALPKGNGVDVIAAWVNVAYINNNEVVMVKSRHYINGGWYNKEDGYWMSDSWWRVYAWQPWPEAPPLREVSE